MLIQILVMLSGLIGVWMSFYATRKIFGQFTGLKEIVPDNLLNANQGNPTNPQLLQHLDARISQAYENTIEKINQVIRGSIKEVEDKNKNDHKKWMHQIKTGQILQIVSYVLSFLVALIYFINLD